MISLRQTARLPNSKNGLFDYFLMGQYCSEENGQARKILKIVFFLLMGVFLSHFNG